jgi:bla regulator protein BlaR1
MIADFLRALAFSALVATAAILLVLLLRKSVRARFGANVAYALWALVPLATATALLPAPVQAVRFSSINWDDAPALAAINVSATSSQFDVMSGLLAAWLLGLAICVSRLIWQQRSFVRALGRLSAFGEQFRTVRAESIAGCPALVGAWRPRIVLPADFEQRYSTIERELILAHERAHCARGDVQSNVAAAALRCLYWFNPLFHFAASRFRFDQELACDAAVIARFPEARRPYADAMLKTQLADIGLPAGCYWQSSHPLKERISMLKQPLPGRARRGLGLFTAIAFVAGGTYAAWAAQPAPSPSAASTSVSGHASYRKLHRIAYPPAALAAKTNGVVYVKVHIGADGAVAGAELASIGPRPDKLLAEAALSGVRTWTFNPASIDGKPTASDEVVPIVFFLDFDAVPRTERGTLESIQVGPPEVEAVARAEYVSPTEVVEYRKNYPPKYPLAAIQARQQGKIVLKVHVGENGKPLSAEVFQAEPAQAEATFAETSIAAVMQWQFNPGLKQGKAAPGDVLVPFTYAVDNRD